MSGADTWTVWFDLSTPEGIAKFTKNTEAGIDEAIAHIQDRDRGNFMRNRVPVFSAKIAYSTYDSARSTKKLSADANCVGCGLCAAKCPVKAIEIRDKRPVWVKDKCALSRVSAPLSEILHTVRQRQSYTKTRAVSEPERENINTGRSE